MKGNVRSILTVIVAVICYSADAQQFESGVKGGFNASTLYVDDVEDTKIRPGFHIGVYGYTPFSENVGIQLELLFSTAGNRTIYNNVLGDGQADFNLNYIQIPGMATIRVGSIFDINLGMYASYLINATSSYDGRLGASFTELDRGHFNEFDYGFAGGLGINFQALQIGTRLNLGMKEIASSDLAVLYLGSSKNVVGQIFVAVGF